MLAVSEQNPSPLFRALRLTVLLSAPVFAGAVQLAVIPSQTGMASYLTGEGLDGAFYAQNIMTIAALAMAFGAPIIGWLAGKLGKRNTLLASMIVYGLAGLVGAVASDLYSLFASRLLLGLASAGYVTVAVSFIGDYYTGEGARDRLLGWFAIVGGGGSLVTLKLAGQLAKSGGWHAPFIIYGLALPLFVMALFLIKDVRRAAGGEIAATASDSVWGAWWVYLLIILISISMYAVTIQGTYLMTDEGLAHPESGLSDLSTQSNILLLSTIGSMAGAYLFRFIRPSLGFYMTLALTWAAVALGNIGFASTLNAYLLAVFAALVGVSSGLMQPLTQSTILHMVTPSASARALGLALGCIFAGQFIHPFVVTPLRAAFGLHDAFLILGVASLAAAAISALWRFVGARRAIA